MIRTAIIVGLAAVVLWACSSSSSNGSGGDKPSSNPNPTQPGVAADVSGVTASGEPGSYTLSVTVTSPDRGCEQYANWWEVVTGDGHLVYRRILAHSHVDEQPFTRSGGPVAIAAEDEVIVRAHMHPGGYGGTAMRGTVASGFRIDAAGSSIAPELAEADPRPQSCAF